jgi:hypothetical protein
MLVFLMYTGLQKSGHVHLHRSENRAASADGAACAAAEKHKVAKYKEVMRLSPTAQFIPFIMEANGRLGKEAQKLLIALSCAIVPHGEQTSRRLY